MRMTPGMFAQINHGNHRHNGQLGAVMGSVNDRHRGRVRILVTLLLEDGTIVTANQHRLVASW